VSGGARIPDPMPDAGAKSAAIPADIRNSPVISAQTPDFKQIIAKLGIPLDDLSPKN